MQEMASALVARHTGLHPVLSTTDNALILLPRYLRGSQRALEEGRGWSLETAPLPRTAADLWKMLPALCSQAADMLQDL